MRLKISSRFPADSRKLASDPVCPHCSISPGLVQFDGLPTAILQLIPDEEEEEEEDEKEVYYTVNSSTGVQRPRARDRAIQNAAGKRVT